jgi:hypothetical protein
LKIDLIIHSAHVDEILDDVKAIVKRRINLAKDARYQTSRNITYSGNRKQINDLYMYLSVYDYYEKSPKITIVDTIMAIGSIADKKLMHPDRIGNKEEAFNDRDADEKEPPKDRRDNVIRKYRLYLKHAKKIIQNAEEGNFPGIY